MREWDERASCPLIRTDSPLQGMARLVVRMSGAVEGTPHPAAMAMGRRSGLGVHVDPDEPVLDDLDARDPLLLLVAHRLE